MAQLALIAMVAGTVIKGVGDYRQGISQARQLKRKAGQVMAQSQRQAAEERRQAELVESRARAVAGASGTDVESTGLKTIYGDIAAEGEYRALTALWNGEEEAIGLNFAAKNAKSSAKWALAGSLLEAGGIAGMGMKDAYGGGFKGKGNMPTDGSDFSFSKT